jgi:hypothetical protein
MQSVMYPSSFEARQQALWLVAAVLSLCAGLPGCTATSRQLRVEGRQWQPFQLTSSQRLTTEEHELQFAIRPGYCYRIFLSTREVEPPRLSFRDEIDADLVGFPLHQLAPRSPSRSSGSLAVYGLCSQGRGAVTLVASSNGTGEAAWYESAFHRLTEQAGLDVAEAAQWLHQRELRAEQQRLAAAEAARQARLAEIIERDGAGLQEYLASVVRQRGRYRAKLLDEVHGGEEWRETFALDPGRCYLFGLLPNVGTNVEGSVFFTRIRNATERTDLEGVVTYSVCTAPSGPMQEATFVVQASASEEKSPPVFAVTVAHRRATAAERRAANREWRRNEPERE